MHPADINAAIRKAGSSQAQIARSFAQRGEPPVTHTAVSLIVHGRSHSARIARRISEVTRIPVARLWPGRYPAIAAEEAAERGAARPRKVRAGDGATAAGRR